MKKMMHGLFGESSEEKKHHEQVNHHPEDLSGAHLKNQPIQAHTNTPKESELAGIPRKDGPINLNTRQTMPAVSSLRSPSDKKPQVAFDEELHHHTPWLQLHNLDNAVELMIHHLEQLDKDVDMAFDSLGMHRHTKEHQKIGHHHEESAHHEEFSMDWTNENSLYRIEIPMGYNINPQHIQITRADRVLIVTYKNSLNTKTGHMEEELIKKIWMPKAVDAKKLRVLFKPEGYLLIEGPELQKSQYQEQHLASAAGESVKRDYADAVSHGVKKLRDEKPAVIPKQTEVPQGQSRTFEKDTSYASKVVPPKVSEARPHADAVSQEVKKLRDEKPAVIPKLPETPQGQTKTFEKETTYASKVVPPKVSEVRPQLGSHLEPRGPYIQEQNRPMAHQQQQQTRVQQTGQRKQPQNQTQQTGQRIQRQQQTQQIGQNTQPKNQTHFQQTGHPLFQQIGQPMFQQKQTVHGRFEGPLDTSGFVSIQPSSYQPGYLPEHQVRHEVNRGVEQVKDKAEDIKHQAGHKWEDTKDKAAELKDKAGDKLHDAKESVKETWEDTKDKAAELTDKAGDKLHDAKEGIKHGWESTKEKASELADKAGDKLETAKDKIVEGWENTKEKASELAGNVGDKLEAAKDTVVEKTKAAKDKVVDALTPDEKPEHHEIKREEINRPIHHEIRREEINRPIQPPVVQKEHVRIEKDYEYTKPAVVQPLKKPEGRVETKVQRPEEQPPNKNLHWQQVQQSIHHGHVNQPQAPQLPQFQQSNRHPPLVRSNRVKERHHRTQEQQPLKHNVNLAREAFQTQQPVERRRSEETHSTESRHTERQSEHTERQFQHSESQQDTQVPLVDTAVGRRMFEEDSKKPPSSTIGIEKRDWVNKPELRTDHINKVSFDDIMKQCVAPSASGTGKSQVHFTPPAEGGQGGIPEKVDTSQQLHRDVSRPQPEDHKGQIHQTQIHQEQQPLVQRHEVPEKIPEKHEHHHNKLERGLEKVTDKVLGFFGVGVEGHHHHHKPSEKVKEVKNQAKQKGAEIKHRAGEKVDQAKNKAGETKNVAVEKIDQAGSKAQEIKRRAGEKIDQAGNKALEELKRRSIETMGQAVNKVQELENRAGNKVRDTKEHAGEAWERMHPKTKTAEVKDQAGQKFSDVKQTAGLNVDQAKATTTELKNKAGDKLEEAKNKTAEKWDETKHKAENKLEDAKESVKGTWENTKEKAGDLADKAGNKLEAAKDTVVEKSKAAKDKIVDAFTPSDKPEHNVQQTDLHRQQPQRITELNRQQQQLPPHGQRTRIEKDYEYSRPLGTNQQNLNRPNVNIQKPQPMVSEFQNRQPLLQPGVTHFEKHVEQHRETPGPTGKVEEHFEHHEVLPGQQPLYQRSGLQQVQRPGETVGHKFEHAKESVSDTVEEGIERGEQMVHKAGEKLHDAKEKVGEKLHDAKESVKETWEDTKDKAAELTDKAGDKLHDAKEGIKHGWENTKEKTSELADKVGDKLHDAKETVVDAKDAVAEKLTHAKDKVVDFFTPEPTHEHVEHKKVSSPDVRPASNLRTQTSLEQGRREERHGKPVPVSVGPQGPVTISGRGMREQVLASDVTYMRTSNVSTNLTGSTGTAGSYGARSERTSSQVTGARNQQQQIITMTQKVIREETKIVAPGGLFKKSATSHQSPQAL